MAGGLDDPFYRPVWLRLLLVAICLGWAVFELVTGARGFAFGFGGLGLYLAWRFFVTYNPDRGDSP